MKNIGLLGGSFNPVTSGHLYIAESVLKECNFIDEIWLMPCYSHIFGKDSQYRHDRLLLLNLIETEKIKNFTYEIDNSIKGGTYATLQHIKKNPYFADKNFSMVIGSDCCFSFEKWINYEKLASEINFIIVPRKGYDLQNYNGILSKAPHLTLKTHLESETSSTEIRKKLKKGESIKGLVPEKVERYLMRKYEKETR